MIPRRRRTHLIRLLGVLTIAALAAAGTAAAAGPAITVTAAGRSPIAGIQDDRIAFDADPAARVRRLADAGAAVIRVDLRWDAVATARPANPTDPSDPAYSWGPFDAIVAAAAANRVQVLFAVYGTPAWARDPGVVLGPDSPPSAIRPLDPADFGRFGEAAARRYAPIGVHRWEGWNEANIALFLWPQYERVAGRWRPVSPATYSALQSSFYAGVKRADPRATIAGAVTAPAGNRCPTCPDQPPRVTPDDFIAALGKPGLRPPMDVVSHHPYPLRAPTDTTPPGRTYIDLYNLATLTKAIDRTYLRGKPLWLTEYGFATAPVQEYPFYFSRARQATYIADAYRRMKANRRVRLAVYYLLQDHPGWKSGVLDLPGRKKPGYDALALPFAQLAPGAVRAGAAVVLVGQARVAPAKTTVLIQRRVGSRWVKATSLRTGADGSFRISLRPRSKTVLRARWSGVSRTGAAAVNTSPAVTIVVR